MKNWYLVQFGEVRARMRSTCLLPSPGGCWGGPRLWLRIAATRTQQTNVRSSVFIFRWQNNDAVSLCHQKTLFSLFYFTDFLQQGINCWLSSQWDSLNEKHRNQEWPWIEIENPNMLMEGFILERKIRKWKQGTTRVSFSQYLAFKGRNQTNGGRF